MAEWAPTPRGGSAGVVVDALRAEFPTVIKPLGALFSHVES